jgi:molybdopterin converting factor small subunit
MEIRLFATLRTKYTVPEGFTLAKPTPVREVLSQLGIPEGKASIVFINGKHAVMDDDVQPDDTMSVFPPIGGG